MASARRHICFVQEACLVWEDIEVHWEVIPLVQGVEAPLRLRLCVTANARHGLCVYSLRCIEVDGNCLSNEILHLFICMHYVDSAVIYSQFRPVDVWTLEVGHHRPTPSSGTSAQRRQGELQSSCLSSRRYPFAHIHHSTLDLPTKMFARRAVSTVARRAVVARPMVPARSFANSMRRCECALSRGSHGGRKCDHWDTGSGGKERAEAARRFGRFAVLG